MATEEEIAYGEMQAQVPAHLLQCAIHNIDALLSLLVSCHTE
jgi:hypothetical protein